MANEIRIVIRGDDDSRSAFNQADRSAERLDQTLQDAADSAAELGNAAHESGGTISSALGERASGALDNLTGAGGGVGEMLGKLGPWGKAAGAAIGAGMLVAAMAVKGLHAAIDASIQRASDLGRMKAQLLLDPKQAGQYAKTAAKVYTDNWGESLEQSADYVRAAALYIMPTASQMKGAAQPSLDAVSERVAALASTMDEDSTAVARAVHQMLVTGMASSVDEAFNLIHAGIAKGANSADDLLDTMNEYGTQFRKMGLDGATAMGLLSQGLKAGARDADLVADAIKEFSIRSIDGSTLSAQGFKALGLDAQKMTAQFAKGGKDASDGLQLVLQRLRDMKDPVAQAAAATALFGTQAEDLGAALYALDPTTAAKGLGDIANAADTAAAHMSGNAYSAVEAYRRKWEMFKADIGDKFLPVFERVMSAIESFATQVGPKVKAFLADLQTKWDANRDKIAQFGDLMEKVLGFVGPSVIGLLMLAISTLVNTITLIGSAWERVKSAFATSVGVILTVLGTIVHGAAAAFGWMPGIGPKLQAAAADFDGFAGRVNRALASIQNRTVYVDVVERAPRAVGSTGHVSNLKIAASGGTRTGLTRVGEHGSELLDLGARGAHIINNDMAGGYGAGGGGTTVITVGAAGNAAGMMAEALNTLLRYMVNNGSIKLTADLRTGQVRVA